MGSTIWIEVDGVPGCETHEDLSVLHALADELDALAKTLGVTEPSAFYDYAALLPVDEREGPEWFDAREGLRAMAALRAALEEDFGRLGWTPDASRRHFPESLLREVRFCERVLSEGARSGRRFRLMIVG